MIRTIPLAVALVLALGAIATSAQTDSARPKLQTAIGVVKTVSASTFTVERRGVEIMFATSPLTRFVGKGTASDLVLRQRGRQKLSDFVKPRDRVHVSFRQSDDAVMTAVEVRVVRPPAT